MSVGSEIMRSQLTITSYEGLWRLFVLGANDGQGGLRVLSSSQFTYNRMTYSQASSSSQGLRSCSSGRSKALMGGPRIPANLDP